MDYGKSYTKIPVTVTARQWTPHSIVPCVTNLFLDIPDPSSSQDQVTADNLLQQDVNKYFAAGKTIKVCYKGLLKLEDGTSYDVKPLDWVLYKDGHPMGVMTDDEFGIQFSDKFELCDACQTKSKLIKSVGRVPTFDEIVSSIESGKTVVLSDGSQIKSMADLKLWAELNGVNI